MKKFREKLENYFAAAAFAEAGEHEFAARLAGIAPGTNGISAFLKAFENIFAAAAFAEAGCPDLALERAGGGSAFRMKPSLEDFLKTVGLQHIQVRYGMVTA